MIETIMIIVVFMVVLIVGLAFFFKFSMSSLEETGEDICMVSNTVLLSSITSMPEVECSVNGKTQDCIDTTKLVVFDPAREYGSYFSTICNQRVYFEDVYPVKGEEEVECTQGTYPDCNLYSFYDSDPDALPGIKISTPVSLYYPLTEEYTVGKLVVEVLQ